MGCCVPAAPASAWLLQGRDARSTSTFHTLLLLLAESLQPSCSCWRSMPGSPLSSTALGSGHLPAAASEAVMGQGSWPVRGL